MWACLGENEFDRERERYLDEANEDLEPSEHELKLKLRDLELRFFSGFNSAITSSSSTEFLESTGRQKTHIWESELRISLEIFIETTAPGQELTGASSSEDEVWTEYCVKPTGDIEEEEPSQQ